MAIRFDVDPKQAIKTRDAEFTTLAKGGTWVAAAHLPFPGIGHVSREGRAFYWAPVNSASRAGTADSARAGRTTVRGCMPYAVISPKAAAIAAITARTRAVWRTSLWVTSHTS